MVTGRKPKEDGQKVNRVKPTHEWVEVPDVVYSGARPACPVRRKATIEWWADVTTMPHCILWTASDWRFAIDTARLHSAYSSGKLALAGELRIREAMMGTTDKARRDLRIRYVDIEEEAPEDTSAAMTPEQEERWRKVIDGDA